MTGLKNASVSIRPSVAIRSTGVNQSIIQAPSVVRHERRRVAHIAEISANSIRGINSAGSCAANQDVGGRVNADGAHVALPVTAVGVIVQLCGASILKEDQSSFCNDRS